jgi:hypothetical protein
MGESERRPRADAVAAASDRFVDNPTFDGVPIAVGGVRHRDGPVPAVAPERDWRRAVATARLVGSMLPGRSAGEVLLRPRCECGAADVRDERVRSRGKARPRPGQTSALSERLAARCHNVSLRVAVASTVDEVGSLLLGAHCGSSLAGSVRGSGCPRATTFRRRRAAARLPMSRGSSHAACAAHRRDPLVVLRSGSGVHR